MKYKKLIEQTKHTRFPVNRPPQPHTQKHPNGYLTPILKKLLNQSITVHDSEVKKVLEIKSGSKAPMGKVLALQWILNGISGDNQAIKEIFDRIDGKILQELKGTGFGDTKVIIVKSAEENAGNNIRKKVPETLS